MSKLLRVMPGDLISNVSDQISVTWDVQIDPDELDLRWHDSSGDTFVLSNTINTCHLLSFHRPQWCRQQDTGTLFPTRPFTDFKQPNIMRLCCHRALPAGYILAIDCATGSKHRLLTLSTVVVLASFLSLCFLSVVLYHLFSCSAISALNMTKRDSITANLPSPRDLRMASEHETDVPMTLVTGLDRTETASGYTSQSVPIPMLLSSSSSAPNLETHAPLQPTQWRQRIVHTRTFKIYEYGNGPAELVVEEVDSSAHSHGRPLEYFFNGIVGHVRDQHGKQVDGWHQAAQLANYWRRHFGLPEDSHPYHDYNPDDGAVQRM